MTSIAIVGAGPGLGAAAAARRFGTESFSVAVVSRSQDRVDALAGDLTRAGETARGYADDVREPDALNGALTRAADDLGPVEVLQYSPVPQAAFMYPVLDTTVADLTGAIEFSVYRWHHPRTPHPRPRRPRRPALDDARKPRHFPRLRRSHGPPALT
jgi:short-subunit dehydrogenase